MKKIITVFIFSFLFGECFSQAGEWVWLSGQNSSNNLGSFGVQGIPSPSNKPPSLYEACEWTDLNGNFWLFGGLRGGINAIYSDVWKYDPLTNEWTWVNGAGTLNPPPVYGTQGIASPANRPRALGYGINSWVDLNGNFWLFGGGGTNAAMSDLWKYDPSSNEWTWMKGTGLPNQSGIYGIQGIPDTVNNPPGRTETAVSWTDNAGNLWLFGGTDINFNCFNDLWKYTIATNEWTWMKGSQFTNQYGYYGIKGIEDTANVPRARWAYSHWKDSIGNLWFFAGNGINVGDVFNDLWRFNPSTNNWTWINGDSTLVIYNNYGTKCIASPASMPCSRFENRAAWTDNNNFWTFGVGFRMANDLWKYSVNSNEWTWVSGDSAHQTNGHWGVKGVSSPTNIPPALQGAIGWTDNNGHLYLFGGEGNGKWYNALWRYTIDTNCFSLSIQENNFTNDLLVFPNPTNSSLTISFSSSEKQTVELRIYNTLGKQIYFEKQEISKGKFEKEINVDKWSDGIYFLQVKTKEGLLSKKVVVEK